MLNWDLPGENYTGMIFSDKHIPAEKDIPYSQIIRKTSSNRTCRETPRFQAARNTGKHIVVRQATKADWFLL